MAILFLAQNIKITKFFL